MATNNPWLLKLRDIKYNHGEKAKQHFIENSVCKTCCEDKIACLTTHHVYGKAHEVFETLCYNCHMLLHATKTKNYTAQQYKQYVFKCSMILEKRNQRDTAILDLLNKGMLQAEISQELGITIATIKGVIQRKK